MLKNSPFFETEISYVEQIDINQNFHNFASTLFRYEDTSKKKFVTDQYFHTQIEFRKLG